MPQTTTAQNACDIVLAVDNDSGILVDISGSTNQVNCSFTHNVGEVFTFATEWPNRLVCGKDATFNCTVLYTTTADEGWDIVKGWYHLYDGASRTVRLDIPNSDSGSDRYLGEMVLTDYDHDLVAGEGGPIVINFTLLPDGEMQFLEIGT